MAIISNIVRELIGLFIDDRSLATATVVILGVAGLARHADMAGNAAAAFCLCGGLAFVLLENVLRSARTFKRPSHGRTD